MVTNATSLATSTSAVSYKSVEVAAGAEDGTYASVPDFTLTSFKPFSFSASNVYPLWTFTVAGLTYSFDATSMMVNTKNSHFINITGTGYASVTGYADSPGTFSITLTDARGSESNKTYTFGASFTASRVPETASMALLIGLGFSGVFLSLRKRRRRLGWALR